MENFEKFQELAASVRNCLDELRSNPDLVRDAQDLADACRDFNDLYDELIEE